ncbi:Flp family type IVb pilin [Aureliella helgolandensis]|uniref:Flp/Fap pilin component n=1 Tax=Aureliella helgolandensis TaxID=2527968 RepID=A0A518GG29_9BACT|nr:Flp family type IVb pilin [Aureliella helgolandensis]QDV27556.1 Flp/Fap pilin component [Aureliella helgolandensis]
MKQCFKDPIVRLFCDEDGPTAVEYAVLLALIVVVCLGAVGSLAVATGGSFDASSTAIDAALGP